MFNEATYPTVEFIVGLGELNLRTNKPDLDVLYIYFRDLYTTLSEVRT